MNASYAKLKDRDGNEQGWGLWIKLAEDENSPNEGDIIPVKTKAGDTKREKIFEKLTSFEPKDEPGFRLEKWSKWETDRSGKFIKAPERQFAPPEGEQQEEESAPARPSKATVKNASPLEDAFDASSNSSEIPF